jgi:peptide/nickel transport system permease protein
MDAVLMRTVDAMLAFPLLLLLILVAALFRPGPLMLVAVLGLTSWMGLARLVRGQVLSLKKRPFIDAARVSGTSGLRIWTLHYLPNLRAPLAQDSALRMGDLVLAEATLSFLGLGLPATIPSWGALVAEGQRVMVDGWWLSVFPGLAITVLVVGLALIGDGLQEAGKASG